MRIPLILCIMTASLLTGCSSVPKYPNTLPKNVTINMTLGENDRGGFFTSVDVAAGVNDLDRKCNIDYKGYVKLEPGKNEIGLAPGQLTYLLIEIVRSSYSSAGSFSRGTLLIPKKDAKYEIDFNYIDSMFDLRIYEIYKSKKRELDPVPLDACMPAK